MSFNKTPTEGNNTGNGGLLGEPVEVKTVPKSLEDPHEVPVTGVPAGGSGPEAPAGGQEWTTGICDCAIDPRNAFEVCLCHPLVISMQFNKLTNDRSSPNFPLCLSVLCCDVFITGGLALLAETLYVRYRVTERYNLRGESSDAGSCLDFFKLFATVLCCTGCATCQNHREMVAHGEWPGSLFCGEDPALTGLERPGEVTIA